MARKFNSACKLECWRHYGDIVDAYKLQLVEMAHKEIIINCGVKEGSAMISISPNASSVFVSSHHSNIWIVNIPTQVMRKKSQGCWTHIINEEIMLK